RLIRISSFIVPSADQYPRLRFWHWFSFGYETYGTVEVQDVSNATWTAISSIYAANNSSGVWTRPSLDLRNYAGKTIRVAFRIQSQCCGPQGGPGWYVDDVS